MKRAFNISILHRTKKTMLLLVFVFILALIISCTFSIRLSNFYDLSVKSTGTIKTIGVEAFYDRNCENKMNEIDWGLLWPGRVNNFTLYIRNISNVKTILSIFMSNITPNVISEYIDITWNYNQEPLNSGEVIQVNLFVSFSTDDSFKQYLVSNFLTPFNVDIFIIAHESSLSLH